MKGYPKTQFDIINNTSVNEITTGAVSNPTAILMATYTSDKGEEDWELLYGLSSFTDRKGQLNFTKHGQAQLAVAEMLRNGAYVFAKRMVSKDATIGNTILRARVVQATTDAAVSYLYLYTSSVVNTGDKDTVFEEAVKDFDPSNIELSGAPENFKYYDVPVMAVTALGRGASNTYVRLVPEYYASKGNAFLKYSFEVIENSATLENIMCSINPDVIMDGVNQSVNNKVNNASNQVSVKLFEDAIYALVKVLATTATLDGTAVSETDLINMDFLNGRNQRGTKEIGGIVTKLASDEAAKTLWNDNKPSDVTDCYTTDDSTGLLLKNGSNGALGNTPVANQVEYEKLLLGAWGADTESEQFNPVIYDQDANKIDAIFDCAYPVSVKNAIINLVDCRGDCVFLADLGTSVKTISDMKSIYDTIQQSEACGIYHNFWPTTDPYTKKQVVTTMPYMLIPKVIRHISNGVGRPFAGIANGITFPDVNPNSVNFLPVVIPGWDQKQELADMNINYVSKYDDQLVMETMYTNSPNYTQLSYLHNVMAIQEIIKLIRTRCPKTRYTFLDGDDLETYIEDCRAVINEYKTNFRSIDVTYMADERYESNNIFYAVIQVQFKHFIQEEYFKIIAIN